MNATQPQALAGFVVYSRRQDTYVLADGGEYTGVYATRAEARKRRAEVIDTIPSSYLPMTVTRITETHAAKIKQHTAYIDGIKQRKRATA